MRNGKYSKTATAGSPAPPARCASQCPIKALSDNQNRTTAIVQARVTSLFYQDERTIGFLPERVN
jgi:hypothetical protein